MFAVIGKQHNLLRSKLSLASIVGILLEPAVVLCALGAVAAFHEEPFEAPYVILSLILFSLTFPGTSRVSDGYLTIVRDILLGWLVLAGLLLLFGYASGYLKVFPQEVIFSWFVATPIALVAADIAAKHLIPRFLAQEWHDQQTERRDQELYVLQQVHGNSREDKEPIRIAKIENSNVS